MQFEPLAQRGRPSTAADPLEVGLDARRRLRRRRAKQVLEHPLAALTGDVRLAADVTVRMLPWPSRPRRGLSAASVDAAQPAAADVGDAVVPRQPLVHEGEVGSRAGRRRCGPRGRWCGTAARSRAGTTARRLPSKSGESGPDVLSARAGTATARRSCRRARRRADPAASAAPAARAPAGCCSVPAPPRRAAHRPEYCSTGRTTAATPARGR